jgi:hypothetical protein
LGCRGFSGAARVCPQGRAERALAAAGVLGQALLPGRKMPLVLALSIFEEGLGVAGAASLRSGLGFMAAGWPG